MIWKPNVTVAAVIEKDGKFLLVEEQTSRGIRLNQPAGHLESDESIVQAVVRETLEESGYSFEPQYLLGIYRWRSSESGVTYLRFAFTGEITGYDPDRPLDEGILRTLWFSLDEIRESQSRHRSPLILQNVEDYLSQRRYPLELLIHYE